MVATTVGLGGPFRRLPRSNKVGERPGCPSPSMPNRGLILGGGWTGQRRRWLPAHVSLATGVRY